MSCGRELSLETAHVRWLKHLIIIACIIDCCALHRFQIYAIYYTAQYIQTQEKKKKKQQMQVTCFYFSYLEDFCALLPLTRY